jgi:hypothetical protein
MNRIVVLGVAMFFALVGIALVGGENKASALGHRGCNGYGCNGGHGGHGHHGGCNGWNGCNGYKNGCCASSCHGRKRCFGRKRHHGGHGCHHGGHGCNGYGCNGGYKGGYAAYGKGPVQGPVGPKDGQGLPPAPPQ